MPCEEITLMLRGRILLTKVWGKVAPTFNVKNDKLFKKN
jgi:hypothetical protein